MVEPSKQHPLTNDWTVPAPPPGAIPPKPTIRGVRVSIGIVLALAGHLLTFVTFYVGAAMANDDWADTTGRSVLLGCQLVVAAACLLVGLVLAIRRRDGGIGLGLLIGWLIGLIVIVYHFLGDWLFDRIEI
ncbi:MAG TPA: hypothetical protein VIL37_01405 [Natronosporangium sp.]